MRKVFLIFGTRPEAIKLAPVIRQLRIRNGKFKSVVCVTAQHRQMLDQVLNLFNIVPDYDLNIMTDNQDLYHITIKTMEMLQGVLRDEKPDIILVQGDTTTSFAASLGAFYFKIPLGHVEAGLRTYNKYSPFPEEKNRHLLSVLADFHFAPTSWARRNLLQEHVPEDRIWVTGNTVIDALMEVMNNQKAENKRKYLYSYFKEKWGLTLSNNNNRMILVTCHRRENFGEVLRNICFALKEIAENRPGVNIVYPVHLNPHIQKPVNKTLGAVPNIHLIDPLDYEHFVFLVDRSHLILTDSGGIQEEAPSLGKPVLVMRNVTERPEGIETGASKLVGIDKNKIVAETQHLLDDEQTYEKMAKALNPYGDGRSAERIADILEEL